MIDRSEVLVSLQEEIHDIAKDHGWWDTYRNRGELIALCHSELIVPGGVRARRDRSGTARVR